MTVCVHGIIKSGRIWMLGSKPILIGKDTHTAFCTKHAGKSQRIIKITAAVSSAVNIKNYSS
jgi:hypothetical protein